MQYFGSNIVEGVAKSWVEAEMSWVEVEMNWVEVDGAGWSWVVVDEAGWSWVHGLVIPDENEVIPQCSLLVQDFQGRIQHT